MRHRTWKKISVGLVGDTRLMTLAAIGYMSRGDGSRARRWVLDAVRVLSCREVARRRGFQRANRRALRAMVRDHRRRRANLLRLMASLERDAMPRSRRGVD